MGKEIHTIKITRNTTIKGVPVSAGRTVSIGDIIATNPKSKEKTMVDESDIKTLLSLERAVEAKEVDEPEEKEKSGKGK